MIFHFSAHNSMWLKRVTGYCKNVETTSFYVTMDTFF